MANYEWQTNPKTGAIRYVRLPEVPHDTPTPPAQGIPDLDELTKDQLIDVAKAQNLDWSGTKAEIKARLRS